VIQAGARSYDSGILAVAAAEAVQSCGKLAAAPPPGPTGALGSGSGPLARAPTACALATGRAQVGAALARKVLRASWDSISRFFGLCLLTDQVGSTMGGRGLRVWVALGHSERARAATTSSTQCQSVWAGAPGAGAMGPMWQPWLLWPQSPASPPIRQPAAATSVQVHMNDKAGELLLNELQPFVDEVLASPQK
jgi:hypothetical protein